MSAADSGGLPRRGRPPPRERAHFAAIAKAMAEEKRLQIERAARAETADGIVVGLRLAAIFPLSEEARAMEEHRAAEQVGLRRRAISLRGSMLPGRVA
ncbi:MAG: hypothetical protein HYY06_19705 [Deltaproteobacteria bacterium]|nr:hypothetical protein [Deltaproteobacteria bacterium]